MKIVVDLSASEWVMIRAMMAGRLHELSSSGLMGVTTLRWTSVLDRFDQGHRDALRLSSAKIRRARKERKP